MPGYGCRPKPYIGCALAQTVTPTHVTAHRGGDAGWVCYAEKTHGEYVLPYISSAKSPMQVMGALVKGPLAARWRVPPERVFHVAVMPCYDKKLEAARDDFVTTSASGAKTPEVDCVLTTTELLELMQQQGAHFPALACTPLDSLYAHSARPPRPKQPPPHPEGAKVFVGLCPAQTAIANASADVVVSANANPSAW